MHGLTRGAAALLLLATSCASSQPVGGSGSVIPAPSFAGPSFAGPSFAGPSFAAPSFRGHVAKAVELARAELTGPGHALGVVTDGSPRSEGTAQPIVDLTSPAPDEPTSDEEIARLVAEDLSALGPMSLGRPNAGAMINAVQMTSGEHWEMITPYRSWATPETIGFLMAAIKKVNAQFSPSHKLFIGHLSREHGGPLRPHRSHQSGRDADISYYYRLDRNPGWYQRASAYTLDLPRTWALVRALVTEADLEYLFIDRSVQRLLKKYALKIGEDSVWLDRIFQFGSREPEPLIRHAWGHATHIHVRFHNPKAQQLGQRAYDALLEHDLIGTKFGYARYRAKGGETLDAMAKRYGSTPELIAKANGLQNIRLRAGRAYSIPYRGRVRRVTEVVIPPRRQPPDPAGASPSRSLAAPEGGGR